MDSKETGIEESMTWQLRLDDPVYPELPGEQDCGYYLRTGVCGYGQRCRFNHPRNFDRNRLVGFGGGGRSVGGEYPERAGQPACQYFLKTGTCKYGATCKYDHPQQGGELVHLVSLNCHGYPLHPGEKECSYYVRTGQCKFGSTCKFHHPEPDGAPVPSPAPGYYPPVQAPTVHSWQVARPTMLPAPYIQPPYGSMMISPGVVPLPAWTPYPPTISPALSPLGQQHSVQTENVYGPSTQLLPSAPAYPGPYTTVSSSGGPSSSIQKEQTFPDRPGQPECQYYIRTGQCKFGPTCKYHHPPEWRTPRTDCVLSPIGLPLRPGAQPCGSYTQRGHCKFGSACKFDHPVGILSYSPSASSFADMPVAPYPVGFSVATLEPSSSASELWSEGMPRGPVGLMFSKGSFARNSSLGGGGGGSEFSS